MLKSVPSHGGSVFLTFDDGPDPGTTPQVLDVLRARGAKATFFVIAEKAAARPDLVRSILADGHALGNHSLDHAYRYFFGGLNPLKNWIAESDRELRGMGLEPVGFRPPAGVVTPKLRKALAELELPLVLWNERFFDAVFPWSVARARRSAARLSGGSIVLLHDRQSRKKIVNFCKTLGAYLDNLRVRGLKFEPLTPEICNRGGQP